MKEKLNDLANKLQQAAMGGGAERMEKRKAKGQLSARERIQVLLDEQSFEEMGALVTHRSTNFGLENKQFFGDGVVTGYGKIDGRPVYVYSQDFTVLGGSLAEAHAEKICRILDLALENGIPVIGINDSGGARIQEGVVSLAGYADIFYRNTMLSGVVPQISAIMGPCAGGAVYSPALTDFICMVEDTSYMFITGPDVVQVVTHEEVSAQELGGATTHSERSGVTHFTAKDEVACLQQIRRLLSYLPSNCEDQSPIVESEDESDVIPSLNEIIPETASQPYDMRTVVEQVMDQDSFMEVKPDFAQNIITGFARLKGKSVGVIANQPAVLAGVLDIQASRKGAEFVRFCDSFNIPLIVFEDVPGFLPGTDQEWNAIITHGAKLLYAFCEATVPRITVITRKAYGGAYDVMNSKHIGADMNFAWPSAEIAVMGASGAAKIIFRKEIAEAEDPEAEFKNKEAEYAEMFAHPYRAAARGYVDEVIPPDQTRLKLIKALEMLQNKVKKLPKKKHGNIPL